MVMWPFFQVITLYLMIMKIIIDVISFSIYLSNYYCESLLLQYAQNSDDNLWKEIDGAEHHSSISECDVFTDLTNNMTSNQPNNLQLNFIVHTLDETNKLLNSVVECMDKQEQRMKEIENKMDSNGSSSSSTPVRNRHKEVPLQVRVSL